MSSSRPRLSLSGAIIHHITNSDELPAAIAMAEQFGAKCRAHLLRARQDGHIGLFEVFRDTSAHVFKRFAAIARFARIRLPSGMVLHDVSIYAKDSAAWASAPSKPMIGREGTQISKDGKPAYSPVVSFATKEVRDRFSAAVIEALREAHPEALS